MKINLKGVTRIVFVFKNFVIKVPNFTICHEHFLIGCQANWTERNISKTFSKCKDCNLTWTIAPTYFCLWFGLFQIQARCLELDRHLTKKEVKYFKSLGFTDLKKENIGWYKDRLVIFDYGQL